MKRSAYTGLFIIFLTTDMKTFKLLFICACAALVAACSAAPVGTEVQEGPYTITTIAENVYHLQDCNDANPSGEEFDENGELTHFNNCSDIYLLVGKEKALIIDLSNFVKWDTTAVASLQNIVAERIGKLPLEITFTHNHGDHTGMLPAFVDNPNVKFMLPKVDFERTAERYPSGELYEEGYEFDLGGMKVATLMVPGHTSGSMVFFLEGQDLLFSGDAIGSGHGVWIFSLEAFKEYVDGVDHLVKYIENEDNGINKDALKMYGGHYWQKDWYPELNGGEFGMTYIYDMQRLIDQIAAGNARMEPSGIDRPVLDTYFKNGQATIAWNAQLAEDWRNSLGE